jgi:hypothetical protein
MFWWYYAQVSPLCVNVDILNTKSLIYPVAQNTEDSAKHNSYLSGMKKIQEVM